MLASFYPHIHHLISPLHKFTNGINNGLHKTNKDVVGLMKDVMVKGLRLFSKSMSKKTSLKQSLASRTGIIVDPLGADLYQTLDIEEFSEIYGFDEDPVKIENVLEFQSDEKSNLN